MAIIGNHIKQPAETFDYDVDYSAEIANTTDLITDLRPPSVAITPQHEGGLEITSMFVNTESNRVKLWVAGGLEGYDYKVEITLTTNQGRTYQDEFFIIVRDF